MTNYIRIIPKPIAVLLWIGLANSIGWTLVAVPALAQSRESAAATARAVDRLDARVDRVESMTMDTRIEIAGMNERIGGLIVRVDTLYQSILDVQRAQSTVMLMALGFFVTISGALVGTLWSIRKGWLRTTESKN